MMTDWELSKLTQIEALLEVARKQVYDAQKRLEELQRENEELRAKVAAIPPKPWTVFDILRGGA